MVTDRRVYCRTPGASVPLNPCKSYVKSVNRNFTASLLRFQGLSSSNKSDETRGTGSALTGRFRS